MVLQTEYRNCPNCKTNSISFSINIYRCASCDKLICDRCLKGFEDRTCPRCTAGIDRATCRVGCA